MAQPADTVQSTSKPIPIVWAGDIGHSLSAQRQPKPRPPKRPVADQSDKGITNDERHQGLAAAQDVWPLMLDKELRALM